ncbi:hypothetical protein [Alienimonas chondri]|uniref:Knr4/Smi1-like domain-containing protein n=1 Tax=Alienimonas chondri TaxID=2681879 RepID=A0ABX1VDT8_9PLAN|nr:hypothetical protein [Alienimonas chondri]NNJ25879.1 hypothetical protein [Alienimonas chondri]
MTAAARPRRLGVFLLRFSLPLIGWAALWGAGWLTGRELVSLDPPPPGPLSVVPRTYSDEEADALAARTNAAWDRIETQLAAKAPRAFALLRPPADSAALADLDARLPRPLPPDILASWQRHDGADYPKYGGTGEGPHAPIGWFRPFTVREASLRVKYWNRRTFHRWSLSEYADRDAPALPSAPLSLGVVPRRPGGDARRLGPRWGGALDSSSPDKEWPELLVDLRSGTLETILRDAGTRPFLTGGGEPQGWVEHLESLADRLESLPVDAPAFADGGFDLSRPHQIP